MITFQVPLPPRELSPNTYKHWRIVSQAKKAYRRDIGLEAIQPLRGFLSDKVGLSLAFCVKGARGMAYQPRDEANALSAFKAGIDGLIDAGLCEDDSRKYLHICSVSIDSKRGPFVEVTVEAL